MPQLLVRGLDTEIVKALKERARTHGVSTEEEHRRILEESLRGPIKRRFEEVIASMPEVGLDEDYKRGLAKERDNGLFD